MNHRQRVIVVTGATGPAGRVVASTLTSQGHGVVAVGSDATRLDSVDASFRFVCDLTDAAAAIELATRVRDEVGAPDGVIHLVGGWRGGQDDEGWRWLEARLVTTLRNATLAFRDDLAASTAGRLAIVSSTSVDRPTWSNANYATAKAAAEAWMAAVASGWAKGGTAAAVTLVIRALGDEEGNTPPGVVADTVASLWDTPATELNGSRIRLAATE